MTWPNLHIGDGVLPAPTRFYATAKRVLDLAVGSTLFAVTLPICAAAAMVVWIEDRKNPFFVSERIGRRGDPFRMWKLRSMSCDAEPSSRRVTRTGKVLRRTKIDELPQLVHVISGRMSLVGPRPHVPTEQAAIGLDIFSEAKPGLTDLSSLVFIDLDERRADGSLRGDVGLKELAVLKRSLSRIQIERRSLRLDLQVLALTGLALISRPRALLALRALLNTVGADEIYAASNFLGKSSNCAVGPSSRLLEAVS